MSRRLGEHVGCTGTLSRAEMQRGLVGLGLRLTPSEMTAVMRAFDVNGDGQASRRLDWASGMGIAARARIGLLHSAVGRRLLGTSSTA